MHIEDFYEFCLSKKGVTESFPFDKNTLVFKVMNKMFALTHVNIFESINLKCDPLYALELRAEYDGVKPGFHMSKKHWNTITVISDVNDDLIFELVNHSYNLVISGLTKKLQQELNEMG